MGIPTFFRSILQKNRSLIRGASAGGENFDYFFIDFNSLIYNTWNKIHKNIASYHDEAMIHQLLIQATVETVVHMVNDIVCPSHYVFISMDGVAPRAKMVQQRSRRYKSVQFKEVLKRKREELGIENPIEWDPSPNICPGTVFMEKMGVAMRAAMKANQFDCQVLLSDVSCPGEGEHKFLKRIRMIHSDPLTRDTSVVVYSPDGDMISLSLLTHKSRVHIMRMPDKESLHESRFCNEGFEFIYCDLDALRKDFFQQLTVAYQGETIDELRILNDYNFLLFMVGNDFVPSLPFLKIRSGGLDILIGIYNRLRPEIRDYLVDYNPLHKTAPKIHPVFFEKLIVELSKTENRGMQQETDEIRRHMEGNLSGRTRKMEEGKTPFEIFETRYQHLCFFSPHHPEASKYAHFATLIDYRLPKHEWKVKYYNHFLGIDGQNTTLYNKARTEMVINYLESLVFTLRYYLQGCPSYDWYYRYRVSPLPSDIFHILSRFGFDMNKITFTSSKPFSPMEQLCFILPPQMSSLLPSCLQDILTNRKYYPLEFDVDALAGGKYIYSEAILPELDTEILKASIHSRIPLLTATEQKRNSTSTRLVYLKKKIFSV